MILRVHHDIEGVAKAGTGLEAIEAARLHRPDVILMNIRMPEMDGLEATSRILKEADWGPRVLILATFDPDEYVYRALRFGASACVLKDIPPEQLATAVRTVAEGGTLLVSSSPGASSTGSRSAASTPSLRPAWSASPSANARS